MKSAQRKANAAAGQIPGLFQYLHNPRMAAAGDDDRSLRRFQTQRLLRNSMRQGSGGKHAAAKTLPFAYPFCALGFVLQLSDCFLFGRVRQKNPQTGVFLYKPVQPVDMILVHMRNYNHINSARIDIQHSAIGLQDLGIAAGIKENCLFGSLDQA